MGPARLPEQFYGLKDFGRLEDYVKARIAEFRKYILGTDLLEPGFWLKRLSLRVKTTSQRGVTKGSGVGSREGVNQRGEVAKDGGKPFKEICKRKVSNEKMVEKWRLHRFLSSPMKLQVGKRTKKASKHVLLFSSSAQRQRK